MSGVSKEKGFEVAGKVTLVYLLLSAVWIAGTNWLLERWMISSETNLLWQTYKDWIFLAVTATVLFVLMKREETKAKKVEERSKVLLQAIPDIVFRFNIDGVFVDFSAEDEKALAMPPEQFLGKNIAEVLPQEIALPMMEAVKKALATGKVQTFEYQIQTPKGLMFSEARIVAKGAEVVAFVRDVTDRARYVEALKNSEDKFLQIFQNNPELMAIASLDRMAFWDVNEAFSIELGYERGEVLGKTMTEINFWKEADKGKQILTELASKGVVKSGVVGLRKKDGSTIYVKCSLSPIAIGGVKGFLFMGIKETRNSGEIS